jgi:5-formyltetrahydrofolate cyclo-ligase
MVAPPLSLPHTHLDGLVLQDAADAKAELRARMRALRRELPADVAALAAGDAAVRVLAVLTPLGLARREVALFHSLPGEIDTGPLALRLQAAGAALSLPRMVSSDAPLRFHRWSPGDPVRVAAMGVREPLPEQPEVAPEVIVVPLLAFDRRRYRLGYGGGYYDRTLAALRARRPVLAIGLAFARQEVERIPTTERDQRLDGIATEVAAHLPAGA